MESQKVFKVKCPHCNSVSFRYLQKETWMFLCHECQRNTTWSKAKSFYPQKEKQTVSIRYESLLSFCIPVSELSADHICSKYVRKRMLPTDSYGDLFFTDKMSVFSQATDYELPDGQPKLIIPFFNENKEMFGLQARSLDGSTPKYVTMMFDKTEEKIFGKDRVNFESTCVCVEGPLDSLFLKNSIAMAGSDGLSDKYKSSCVVAFDNEPRSRQTVGKMSKYLDNGYKVVIWPDEIKQKDVNDMVMSGIDVESIINENVYSGLQGKIKLNSWKRVQ